MESGFVEKYLEQIKLSIDKLPAEKIMAIVSELEKAYEKNRSVFIMGNGGSAVTANHFACDLAKGTLKRVYDKDEKRFRVVSLADNIATITAYANDLGFENIFFQQLHNLLREKDVVIALTGSGNSPNILKALEYAKEKKAVTIAFLGFDGGKAAKIADYSIIVPCSHYGRIEDLHMMLVHLITDYFFTKKNPPVVP